MGPQAQDFWTQRGYKITDNATLTPPLRAHDQKKTLSQLFIDGGLAAVEKECDARVDRATFKITELQDQLAAWKLDAEATNAANVSLLKANAELGNKWAAQKQKILELEKLVEWHRSETSKVWASAHDSRQKLYAIQKAIDKEQAFGRDYLFASTIKEILGGKTIG